MPDFKANHWALLDLTWEKVADGFIFTATTDVPCHLYCRMTKTPPVKRKFAAFRRGIYLQGDYRFCFVVYEDNEQEEAGDTLIHTFFKFDWPHCETRWFYFVGTQAETPSVSETAIFKFHFTAPDPLPHPSYLPLSIGPFMLTEGTGNRWITYDLSDKVPWDATGVLLYVRWRPAENWRRWCVRPTGSGFNEWSVTYAHSHWNCFVPLNEAKEIDIYTQLWGGMQFWLLGSFGPQAGWTPWTNIPISDATGWHTYDISAHLPTPKPPLAFLYLRSKQPAAGFGLRTVDGTPQIISHTYASFAAVKLIDGKFQYGYSSATALPDLGLFLAGYVKHHAYLFTDCVEVTPPGTGDWFDVNVADPNITPRLTFLYSYNAIATGLDLGWRSPSHIDFSAYHGSRNNFMAVGPEADLVSLYRQTDYQKFWKHGSLY